MFSTIIAPTEYCYDPTDLKIACLLYDKVKIFDPRERDLFPRRALLAALGGPGVMEIDRGPIRALLKAPEYDRDFQKVLKDCDALIADGALEVFTSWDPSIESGNLAIPVRTGGFPLDVGALLESYRDLARQQTFLAAAIDPTGKAFAVSSSAANLDDGAGDGILNDNPAMPLMEGSFNEETNRRALTIVARSRLAQVVKVWSLATASNEVPLLPSPMANVMDRAAEEYRKAMDAVEMDPYWSRRNAILDVCTADLFDRPKIAGASARDILARRSQARREVNLDRQALYEEIRYLAQEPGNMGLEQFREKIEDMALEYVSNAQEKQRAWNDLGFKCIVGASQKLFGLAALDGLITGILHAAWPMAFAPIFGAAVSGAAQLREAWPEYRAILDREAKFKIGSEFAAFLTIKQIGGRYVK